MAPTWQDLRLFQSQELIADPEMSIISPSPLGKSTGTHQTTNTSASEQQVIAFWKAIICDSSAYKVFKNEKYFDSFMRSFKATAMSQGLGDILDENYVPDWNDDSETQLFEEKQIFMYSV